MSNIEQPAMDAAISNETTVATETETNEKLVVATDQPTVDSGDFLAQLGEELRMNKALQNFKTADDLAKSYIHANQLLGKRMSELSAEDAAHFRKLVNVPESKDDYILADDLKDTDVSWYKEAALKAGLTKEQAKDLADSFILSERTKAESLQKEMELESAAWVDSLKKEFGSAFDKQVEIAKRGVKAFGDDDVVKILNETGLGSHPAVVKMFAKIGRELLEDKLVKADAPAVFGTTPSDAMNQISLKKADAEFMQAYMSPRHPEHKRAVEEMSRLYSLAHPQN